MSQQQNKPYTATDFENDAKKLMELMKLRVGEIEKAFTDAKTQFEGQKQEVENLQKQIDEQTTQIQQNQKDLEDMQNKLQDIMKENLEFFGKKYEAPK